jgi:hypothetical protein
MQIRHIRPGSLEWNDAVSEEPNTTESLTPEELIKLRAAWEMGEAPRPDKKVQAAKA